MSVSRATVNSRDQETPGKSAATAFCAATAHHDGLERVALIVDDDPGILDVYEMALLDLDYKPILVTDGEQALAEAEKCSPSLVILDYRMPGMSGIELIRRLRTLGLRDVPILMVSAQRYHEEEAHAAGASVCLEKPFDVDDFIAIIQQFRQGSTALSA